MDSIRPEYANLGCTLPGRWVRSPVDAERAADSGFYVRVVKGQWPDPSHRQRDPVQGFLAVIDRLAGRRSPVGVATHDTPLAREALRRLQAAGTPCQLEQLFSLPLRPGLRAARDAGVPVRIYVPFGRSWLPYRVSEGSRDPRVLWWFLRDMIFRRMFRTPATLSLAPR
jgi:proline dehydrogenase